MNRLTLPLVAICLGLAGWAVWEHLERDKLSSRVAELEKLTAKPRIPEKHDTKPAAAAVSQHDSDVASAANAAKGSVAVKPGEEGKSMADSLVKIMSDPNMRDAMKAQASMGIDMLYRDLFDLLNLPEPKRSQFEKLIREKTNAGMEIGFSMIGSKKTPEEKKEISDKLQAQTKDLDDQIKALIGEEDFNKVRRYEDSTNERMQLKTLNSMLASKNLDMDEATESKLMDAMYDERKHFPFASNFSNQQNTDMMRFTPENMTRFGEEYGQLSQSVVKRAAGILSAPQLEVFQQSQEQTATMTKMHIEMAGKMFGASEAPANP